MKTRIFIIATLLFITFQMSFAVSQTLNITVCNLKPSNKGTIRIAFFQDEQSFKVESESFTKNYSKDLIKNGTLCVEIPVKPGVYGLSVLDDENDSGKMEYSFLGVPKEGFGFSNFSLKKMRKPKFKDFSFCVQEKEILDVKVKMNYF